MPGNIHKRVVSVGNNIYHTKREYYDEDHWCYPVHLLRKDQFMLLSQLKTDMTLTLMVYKGLRLRDLKAAFESQTNRELDGDLEKLKMKNMSSLLVFLWNDIKYQYDINKEEVFAYASDSALVNNIKDTSHIQTMVYATYDKENTRDSRPTQLIPIDCEKVFLDGHMDCADGVQKRDPRIPIQDLGVAAAKARKEALKNKLFKKKTYEEQVSHSKKPEKQHVTIETTEPVETSKTGNIDDFFNSFEPYTEEPSQSSARYIPTPSPVKPVPPKVDDDEWN